MKKWILLGVATIVAALAAVTLLVFARDPDSSKERGKGAAQAAAPSPARLLGALTGDDSPPNLDVLLLEGTPEAWQKIFALYPNSDEASKRKVLRRIAELKALDQVLARLLATVGDDPTPASEDPMIDEASEVLRSRWQTAEDMENGRRTMLMQKDDKRRWVVAKAMIDFAKGVPEDSPLYAQTNRLKAKLVNVHKDAEDPYVKSSIVQGMHDLGAGDAALIMAKGPNVRDEELEGVREEKAAADEVLKSVGER